MSQTSTIQKNLLLAPRLGERGFLNGADALVGWALNSGWTGSSASASNATTFASSAAGGMYKTLSLASGLRYIIDIVITSISSGTMSIVCGTTGTAMKSGMTAGRHTFLYNYAGAGGSGDFYLKNSAAATTVIASMSIRPFRTGLRDGARSLPITCDNLYPIQGRYGNITRAMYFNGTSDGFTLGVVDNVKWDVYDFSYIIDFIYHDRNHSGSVYFFGNGYYGLNDKGFYCRIASDDKLYVGWFVGTTPLDKLVDTLVDGTRYVLSVLSDRSGNALVYLNNSLKVTQSLSTVATTLTGATGMFVGKKATNDYWAKMTIYAARCFNFLLTDDERLYYEDLNNPIEPIYLTAGNTYLTSGTLVIGKKYRIHSWVTDDSFTSIGAASNAAGIEFVATGETPSHWAHASKIMELGCTLNFDGSGFMLNHVDDYEHGINVSTGAYTIKKNDPLVLLPAVLLRNTKNSNIRIDYDDAPDMRGNIIVSMWITVVKATADNIIMSNGKFIITHDRTNGAIVVTSDNSTEVSSANASIALHIRYFIAIVRYANGTCSIWIGDDDTPPVISGTEKQDSGTPVAPDANADLMIGNLTGETSGMDAILENPLVASFGEEDQEDLIVLQHYRVYDY